MPEHTTLSNLHLTVLNKAGIEMKSLADSTGESPESEPPRCAESEVSSPNRPEVLQGIAGGLAGLLLAPVARVGLAAGNITAAPVRRGSHC